MQHIRTPLRDFFERHKDNPKLYKTTFYLAIAFHVIGFGILNIASFGYGHGYVQSYSHSGFIVLSLIFMLVGIALTAMTRARKSVSDEKERVKLLTFSCKFTFIPLAIIFIALVNCARFMVVDNPYANLTVIATNEVKDELKWIFGSTYPREQEINIDPQTNKWNLSAKLTIPNQITLIETLEKKDHEYEPGHFRSHAISQQKYSVMLTGKPEDITELSIDWDQAEFLGYHETDNPESYPICDLKVPIRNRINSAEQYKVLFNGKTQSELSSFNTAIFKFEDNHISGYFPPKSLPPLMRLDDNHIIIRTNFIGSHWPLYCSSNFSKNNKDKQPEQIPEKTTWDLIASKYTIIHSLFPELENKTKAQSTIYKTELASYIEWEERINEHIAFDILNTTIKGHKYENPY